MGTSSAMSTSNQYIKYKITVTQNSQNVAGNKSNVTVSVKFYRTNTGYETYGTGTVYCKINGTTYSAAVTSSQKITNSGIVLFTKTLDIAHNADGTKTLACSAWIDHQQVTSSEQSYSQTLTTIPRKSTLDIANGTLGTQQTITINAAATGFTHNLTYVCGSASGTLLEGKAGGSYYLTPTLNLAKQNTAGTSVSVKFTLTTYSGGTSIGSNSYTKSFTIPASVTPSCSIQVLDATNYKDTYGNLIQGLSKLYVKVTPTLAYDSPIAAYSTDVSGAKYTAAEFTTPALASSGTVKVTSTVKDKRGRTSAAASASFPVLAYNQPAISALTVQRCNADGSENDQGGYIKATFSATVTALNNKNSAAYKLRYKKTTETSFTEKVFTELAGVYTVNSKAFIFAADSNSSYDVEVVVSDNIRTSSKATSASTAFTLMNWGADGTSIGIGKVAEKANTLQIGLGVEFLGAIAGTIFNAIYPVGSVYISYSHNNPATMFGGTWVRIENAFLWGVDSNGTIGHTGGSKTHTLTVDELPSHTHGSVYSGNAAGTKTHSWLASGGSNMAYGTVATGGGAAHNNMPPYVQVSIWRRTA